MLFEDIPMDLEEKHARIINARMKLKQRFKNKMASTPSLADSRPMGKGSVNRHHMPQVPPDQTVTKKWPVLDLGIQPVVARDEWALKIDGLVKKEINISWDSFLTDFEQINDQSDFHCVTGWSKLNVSWQGVRFADIAASVEPADNAQFVMCYGADGYTVNLPLEEALKPDVLIVYEAEGKPLAREHGGPVRMVTPQLWAWKGAKWINRIEFMENDCLGFWELRGYSNTAYPWRNDRYS